MEVSEVRKLDSYMKRLFGNAKLRIVPRPKKKELAEVYIGDQLIGELIEDDEDNERCYHFQMAIAGSASTWRPIKPQERGGTGGVVEVGEIGKVESYMRHLFGNSKLRVVPWPKKDDSAEVYIGDEFIAELFVDDQDNERCYNFQMAILEADLE